MNHEQILKIAREQADDPAKVPMVETLHQNIAHMTVALKEVECRLIRVVNKMNRFKVNDDSQYTEPLAKCVSMIKSSILDTQLHLEKLVGQERKDKP